MSDIAKYEGMGGEVIAARRRSAATMSVFYCYFFLGAANLDLLRFVM